MEEKYDSNNVPEKEIAINPTHLEGFPNNINQNPSHLEISPKDSDLNSPPLEGCPQDGVVNNTTPQDGVVNNTTPQDGVVNNHTLPSNTIILTTINSIPIFRNFIESLPYNPQLKQYLKAKRKAGILSEVLFWQQVHKGIFHKIDFDRQRIIGNYIVDFYVKTLGLIIEIDGSSHDFKMEYDAKRQTYFEDFGLRVYRITDWEVKKNLSSVMRELEEYIVREYGVR